MAIETTGTFLLYTLGCINPTKEGKVTEYTACFNTLSVVFSCSFKK